MSPGKAGPVIYTCAECGKTFASDWSDEEAHAEREHLWGEIPVEEMAVVCDVCFKRLLTGRG